LQGKTVAAKERRQNLSLFKLVIAMPNDDATCKIKLSGSLTYEGQVSLPMAHQILGLVIGGRIPPAPMAGTDTLINFAAPIKGGSAKAFVATKRPTMDVEKIACLAFYLTHSEGASKFKTADLERVATEAALDISNFPRAVDNATRQSQFLAKAGEGAKQITSLGEEVVNALPERAAVAAVLKEIPTRRRKRTKKKR
jgi:hypothetical protein